MKNQGQVAQNYRGLKLTNVKISNILYAKTLPFFAEKCMRNFAISAKNLKTVDLMHTRRLKEPLTDNFVKLNDALNSMVQGPVVQN